MVESSKKTREPTRLRHLAIRRLGNARVSIDIDIQTSMTLDPIHAQFVNYLGILTRSKMSNFVPD